MNIFILDSNPVIAAQYHADIHLNKMILESAQMLSTTAATLLNNGNQIEGLYKPTHVNHPCNVWLRDSWRNCVWLYGLVTYLEIERKNRFNSKTHKSIQVIDNAMEQLNTCFEFITIEQTPFATAVPDWIKKLPLSPIEKYHHAYRFKRDLGLQMKWTNREVPFFMQ